MSDDIDDDEVPSSGKKRSVRDRLGSNVSDSYFYESQQRNKRYLSWFCYFHPLYRLQSFELHCNILPPSQNKCCYGIRASQFVKNISNICIFK